MSAHPHPSEHEEGIPSYLGRLTQAPLLTAEIGADAPAVARARWRSRVDGLALAILVVTLIAAAGLVALERTAAPA